ncbi:MAG: hypothetical protein QW534_11190 [Candidatus Methanomethylicia archaeon]
MSFKCEFCGESFGNHEELVRHLYRKHEDKIKLAIFEHPIKP